MDHLEWWLQRASQLADCLNRDPLLPETHCFAPPAPPPIPEPVPVKPKLTRRPRKKQPLPPPTTILTRGSKRVLADSQSPDGSDASDGGSKRGRYDEATDDEDEDDSGSEYEPSYTTRIAAASLARNVARGRATFGESTSEGGSAPLGSETLQVPVSAEGQMVRTQSAPGMLRVGLQRTQSDSIVQSVSHPGPLHKVVYPPPALPVMRPASAQPGDVEMERDMERRLSNMTTYVPSPTPQVQS